LLNAGSNWGKFLSKQQTLTAVTVYILVVGLIYNIILRVLWKPEGLQMIVNELLHSVIPVLFLLYWLIYVPKNQLKWKNAWPWLLYPLIYTIYVFIFGAITGFYPYPFIDLTQLGPGKILINVAGVAILFLAFSYLLIAIAKLLNRKNA
jgi:peptidoglycan biosynthesis protein MviN/MurJ (putative lipid II flippase)